MQKIQAVAKEQAFLREFDRKESVRQQKINEVAARLAAEQLRL